MTVEWVFLIVVAVDKLVLRNCPCQHGGRGVKLHLQGKYLISKYFFLSRGNIFIGISTLN